jgi:hypothetical protein
MYGILSKRPEFKEKTERTVKTAKVSPSIFAGVCEANSKLKTTVGSFEQIGQLYTFSNLSCQQTNSKSFSPTNNFLTKGIPSMKNQKTALTFILMAVLSVSAFAQQYDPESDFDGAKGQTSKKSD